MNNKILQEIMIVYNEIIQKVNECNPKEARCIYNKINYVIFTVVNFYRMKDIFKLENSNSIYDVYRILKNINFISKEEIEFIEEFIIRNEEVLNRAFINISACKEKYNIFELYEEVLSLDIRVKDSYFCVVKENKNRDRAGAYYTSKEFAKKITQKTIEKYLTKKCNISVDEYRNKINDEDKEIISVLKNSKYVDLSCGTGNFIIALIEYIKEYIDDKDLLEHIIGNIYGFDIDLVALQIIKTQMVIYTGKINLINKINSNFILGNTLISYNENNYFEKLNLVAQGYIYHLKLGINQNKYDNKFDVILGNPPWEKIRFEDKNFFENYCPQIAEINKKDLREKEILKLNKSNQKLKAYYDIFVLQMEQCKKQIRENNRLTYSSNGELNTYVLFVELAVRFLKEEGYISLIVKSALITTTANRKIFNYLLDKQLIVSLDDFINKNKIFPIDSRERFAVITLGKNNENKIALRMMLEEIEQLDNKDYIFVNKKLLSTINPNNNMIPNISSSDDLIFLFKFYNKFNVFEKEFPKCKFGRLVHLTSHAKYIYHEVSEKTIPIYEGKFIEIYDNKFSTFNDISEELKYRSKANSRPMTIDEKNNSLIFPESRFFIDKEKWRDITRNYPYDYSVVWRSLTSTTNRRTTIASIIPHMPTIQSIQLLQYENDYETLIIILAIFNSCIFDYLVRLKLNGIDLTQSIIKQIPVPAIIKFDDIVEFKGVKTSIKNHIINRINYLYRNDIRLRNLFKSVINTPMINYDNLSNREVVLELDYLISKTYELNIEELISIMMVLQRDYSKDDIGFIRKIEK